MSFKDYVYSNRKIVILILLIITVFAVTFLLYQLTIVIIIYPVVVGLFFFDYLFADRLQKADEALSGA